jgi:hypothetical protein
MGPRGAPQPPQRGFQRPGAGDRDHVAGVVYAGAEDLDPEVDSNRGAGAGVPGRDARSSATVNDTHQRCAVRDTVADRMRAVPSATRPASLVVGSHVAMVPSRGSWTVLPWQRTVPVSRKESFALRRFL